MSDGAEPLQRPLPDARYAIILSMLGELLALAAELDDIALGDRLLDVLRALPNLEDPKYG